MGAVTVGVAEWEPPMMPGWRVRLMRFEIPAAGQRERAADAAVVEIDPVGALDDLARGSVRRLRVIGRLRLSSLHGNPLMADLPDDVLTELLLKLGLDLCVPIEQREIAGSTVHAIGGGVLMADDEPHA